eukprot:11206953-Alexandrium_andersonii.AAC.1
MALCPARRVRREYCVRSLHAWAACRLRTRSRQAHLQEVQYDCLLSRLFYPFRGRKCPGRHEHLVMEGRQADLRQAQVWTWDEAQRVAEGVQLVLEAWERRRCVVP